MKRLQSTLLYNWFEEVWNKGRETAIEEMTSDQTIAHGLAGNQIATGTGEFKNFYHSFKSEFSNIHFHLQHVVSEDNFECALCHVTANHKTGKAVAFSGICMVRVENGKIMEAWNHFDFLSVYQQLGHQLVEPVI